MVCPAAAAAAVQIIQSAVGGTGSGRKPRNRIHTLCGPWKRNVEGKTAGWEALRRSKERRSAKGGRSRRRRCPPSMTSASRPLVAREFSSLTGSKPTHSPGVLDGTCSVRHSAAKSEQQRPLVWSGILMTVRCAHPIRPIS